MPRAEVVALSIFAAVFVITGTGLLILVGIQIGCRIADGWRRRTRA